MIKWKIINLEYLEEKDDLKKVVTKLFYVVEAENTLYSASDYGWACLDTEEVDAASFVSFDRISQETAIGWLHHKLGANTVKEIEDGVLRNLHSNRPAKTKHAVPLRW